MKIPPQIIEAVKDRTDIVDIIGTHVTLKRAGSNYSGLCPFHSEKTPSFTVFPDTQSFFCFGCEAGGDVFTYLMRTENLTYVEAVRTLASRVGVDIPDEDRDPNAPQMISRSRLYEMNKAAARFYNQCLFDPEIGRAGMKYLKEKRGLTEDVIRHFGLGYAPNSFGVLTEELKRKGYTELEMKQGFLCGISQYGKPYDYFRDRVIFPVIDTTGQVVAFSGRDVGGESKAKYLNSSDTPVFSKRRNLFALNFAKNYGSEQLILCEGNMDVVSLHAAGFQNAVASLGTALTDDQARIMTKYTKQVVIAYDSDGAGQHAAQRAMDIFAKVGLDVRILSMKDAKDPDEYIKKFGKDAFARLIKSSSTGFEFKLNNVLTRHAIEQPDEKIKAAQELCEIIAGVFSAAEREVYIRAASDKLSLPAESLKTDVEHMVAKKRKEFAQKKGHEAQLAALGMNDRINPDAVGSIAAASAEDTIIGLLLMYGEHRKAVVNGIVSLKADDFVTPFNRRVFEAIMALEMGEEGFNFSFLGESFTAEEMGRLSKLERFRRSMSENGTAVLTATVASLKAAKQKKEDKQADPMEKLQRILAEKRKKAGNGGNT